MTIEQLQGLTADEFDKITLEELEKILAPSFSVSRPKLVNQLEFKSKTKQQSGGPVKSIAARAKALMKMVDEM